MKISHAHHTWLLLFENNYSVPSGDIQDESQRLAVKIWSRY